MKLMLTLVLIAAHVQLSARQELLKRHKNSIEYEHKKHCLILFGFGNVFYFPPTCFDLFFTLDML